jgi:hypothetical protein
MFDQIRKTERHNAILRESLGTEQNVLTQREQHINSLKRLAEATVYEADGIKANAELEAESLLASARSDADRMRSEAINEGERLKAEAFLVIEEERREIDTVRDALARAQVIAAIRAKERVLADLAGLRKQVNEQFDTLSAQVADLARAWADLDISLDLSEPLHETATNTSAPIREEPENTHDAA